MTHNRKLKENSTDVDPVLNLCQTLRFNDLETAE